MAENNLILSTPPAMAYPTIATSPWAPTLPFAAQKKTNPNAKGNGSDDGECTCGDPQASFMKGLWGMAGGSPQAAMGILAASHASIGQGGGAPGSGTGGGLPMAPPGAGQAGPAAPTIPVVAKPAQPLPLPPTPPAGGAPPLPLPPTPPVGGPPPLAGAPQANPQVVPPPFMGERYMAPPQPTFEKYMPSAQPQQGYDYQAPAPQQGYESIPGGGYAAPTIRPGYEMLSPT